MSFWISSDTLILRWIFVVCFSFVVISLANVSCHRSRSSSSKSRGFKTKVSRLGATEFDHPSRRRLKGELGPFTTVDRSATSKEWKVLESDESFENCKVCGRSFSFDSPARLVINGDSVDPSHKYPWIVYLKKENKINCGGAIISQTFILTAAHCTTKSSLKNSKKCRDLPMPVECFLEASELNVVLLNPDSQHVGTILDVKNVTPNERYNPENHDNDIALVELASPLNCSRFFSPICVSARDLQTTYMFIAGRGRTVRMTSGEEKKILREGVVKRISVRECSETSKRAPDTVICITGGVTNQRTCKGDSGSALFGDFGTLFYALGITSTSEKTREGFCDVRSPATFTKISAFYSWIRDTVQDLPDAPIGSPISIKRPSLF